MYFKIRKLLGFPKMHFFKALLYLNNCSKTTHCTQKYLLDCFIVFLSYSFKILPAKHPFAQVWVTSTFQTTRYVFPGCLWDLRSMVFFSCIMPEKSTSKAGLEVCEWLLQQVLDSERNLLSRQSLPVQKCNIGFVYCLYTSCFHA